MKNRLLAYFLIPFFIITGKTSAQNITTIAGGYHSGDSVAALVGYITPFDVALDGAGNLYIASNNDNLVKRVDAITGIMTIYAGTGIVGFSGDGGPATAATFHNIIGIATDGLGNLYICDGFNYRIRRVAPSGIITTIAGNGTSSYNGEGLTATAAQIWPADVSVDAAGVIYFSDLMNNRVRKISGGIVTTVCGTGVPGFSGDGGPATAATISRPFAVKATNTGVVFVDDYSRIRKIDAFGIITSIAGTGTIGHTGDGGPATAAQISIVEIGMDVDFSGNIYLSQTDHTVRKITPSGTITTFAGIPWFSDCSSDGILASAGSFGSITGFTSDISGNLYMAARSCASVKKINSTGILTTVAGNGLSRYTGDNGPAMQAVMMPASVATDTAGSAYVFDFLTSEVRKLASDGNVYRIAGGVSPTADGVPATSSALSAYCTIHLDRSGNLYVVDNFNNCIRKVGSDSIIHTIAGGLASMPGYSGDGGPASSAALSRPYEIVSDTSGNLYFTDYANHRIRKISAVGIITTYAGTGVNGYTGDGGPATAARITRPLGIGIDMKGNVYIGDSARVRMIDAAGIITTIAGNGTPGYSGDGGPATAAEIDYTGDI